VIERLSLRFGNIRQAGTCRSGDFRRSVSANRRQERYAGIVQHHKLAPAFPHFPVMTLAVRASSSPSDGIRFPGAFASLVAKPRDGWILLSSSGTRATWDHIRESHKFRLQGCHLLCRPFPKVFGYPCDFLLPAGSAAPAEWSRYPDHATPAGYDTCSVWPVPLSLTTTQGIAVAFSSCGY